jgi:2-polyprenyl-3-methyl-5-hydroxy-6-metoxy-1,4-benzoquinol methylase
MKHNILAEKLPVLLESFLTEYSLTQPIHKDLARDQIRQTLKTLSAPGGHEQTLIHIQDAEDKWYNALARGQVDYSVYDQDYYFTDLWVCFVKFSRKYIREVLKPGSLDGINSIRSAFGDVRSVVDLGCGVGLTSAAFTQVFPGSRVYATNLEDTKQWSFCSRMASDYGFALVNGIGKIPGKVDVLFASEYFEHIQRPLEHIQDICSKLSPRHFIIANAFNTRSLGHFTHYKDGANVIDQSKMSKRFNDKLKALGYRKVKTKCWNNRPAIFSRIDQ